VSATRDITAEHAAIIGAILRQHLPPNTLVYVFGSRATGGARRYSDLDLALESDGPLDLESLAEALSESDLPYKVDLLGLDAADPGFQARVMETAIPLDY
jgi:predicted nucleotidyltransferase